MLDSNRRVIRAFAGHAEGQGVIRQPGQAKGVRKRLECSFSKPSVHLWPSWLYLQSMEGNETYSHTPTIKVSANRHRLSNKHSIPLTPLQIDPSCPLPWPHSCYANLFIMEDNSFTKRDIFPRVVPRVRGPLVIPHISVGNLCACHGRTHCSRCLGFDAAPSCAIQCPTTKQWCGMGKI
jgi:hypothetical protein